MDKKMQDKSVTVQPTVMYCEECQKKMLVFPLNEQDELLSKNDKDTLSTASNIAGIGGAIISFFQGENTQSILKAILENQKKLDKKIDLLLEQNPSNSQSGLF